MQILLISDLFVLVCLFWSFATPYKWQFLKTIWLLTSSLIRKLRSAFDTTRLYIHVRQTICWHQSFLHLHVWSASLELFTVGSNPTLLQQLQQIAQIPFISKIYPLAIYFKAAIIAHKCALYVHLSQQIFYRLYKSIENWEETKFCKYESCMNFSYDTENVQ